MVGVIGKLGNQQGRLADMLGMSLGQGLGQGLNTFFANRSLESVMHDKSLEGAPQSKKLEAAMKAVAPFGETGEKLFQQRLQIDQQEQLEKQEAIQKRKGKALNKYFSGEALGPDEQELFTPTEFTAMYKAKNPKPKGGVTAEAVPQDVNQKITEVLSQSQDMSADDLKNVFDSVGIPPIYSNAYIENRRRQSETGTEHDIKFHQETSDFDKKLREHAEIARKQIPLIDNSIKSVSEGKIKPSSLANVFGYFGEAGKKISNALLSGDQARLSASIPEFLEGRKELFGVRLSDADLKILADKLPDIGKSKEANLAILNLMKKAAERSIRMEKISHDVLEKKGIPYRGGKLRPLGYEREVASAFEESENKQSSFAEMPDPKEYGGRILRDKESGTRFKSNGTSWEPLQ